MLEILHSIRGALVLCYTSQSSIEPDLIQHVQSQFPFHDLRVRDELARFGKLMSLRGVTMLSSSLPILLLLVLPLRAQTPLAYFSGVYDSSMAAVWSDSGSRVMGEGQIANAGSAPVCTFATYLQFENSCSLYQIGFPSSSSEQQIPSTVQQAMLGTNPDSSDENVTASAAVVTRHHERPDRNLDIYFRNRREFSLEVGWHPKNIPFVYDFAVGDSYNMTPLKYTSVPIVASLRWHVTNVGWRWIFRGNMDFTFSGSITAIPRGPETQFYAFDFGIRRNFVYRNWKVVPYFEQRGGAGIINAKEPVGVLWAQGQNLTFTYNMGAGVRYNIDSKYSFSGGMNYMHISNGYLSEPAFVNYGINVYGPMFGFNVRFGKPHHHDSE